MNGLGGGRRLRCRLVVLWMGSLCGVLEMMGVIENEISYTTTLSQCTSKKFRVKTNTLSLVTSQLHGDFAQPSLGLLLCM